MAIPFKLGDLVRVDPAALHPDCRHLGSTGIIETYSQVRPMVLVRRPDGGHIELCGPGIFDLITLIPKGDSTLPETEKTIEKPFSITDVAVLCHEANRYLCELTGDMSQSDWKLAPEWQKDSAINGVIFHLDNPDAGPEASHNSWLKQKWEDGWKYGPEKDPAKKEHPCFVPYDELPPAQQAKDHLFRAIVDGLRPFIPDGRRNDQISS